LELQRSVLERIVDRVMRTEFRIEVAENSDSDRLVHENILN